MKRPFFGGVLLALPLSLLAFTACGDESVVNSNIKQISEDEPQSSESLSSSSAKSSSSSAKSSEKKSSSSKAEEASDENDIVESEGDLPRCSIKREGMEVYVKEEKNLYTCEEGEWIPENKTVKSSSSSKKYSSSSNKNPFDIVDGTSSSAIYIDVDFSSSSKVNPVVVTGLGSCAPVTSTIEKGASVRWKLTYNSDIGFSAIDLARADHVWNFGAGAIPATDATPSTSAPVTYTNSGIAVASVTVTMQNGNTETIQCSPLQVNGDPITGCKCTAEAASVDFTATPDITWSVTGCMSASSPLTYNWNGADGGATFTNSFTAATASYAPTLKVGNADNTVIDVPCSAVKVTEGVEYVIKESSSRGVIDLPAGSSIVVLEAEGYSDVVFCNANGSVNGSVNMETIHGQYYVSIRMPAGTLVPGARLEFTLDVPATCGIQ
ncbi:MAG: hypothetical protein IJ912_00640 [Fibrobacter sp.]|nr:hypothetical protein [Fibrobacter sp.]